METKIYCWGRNGGCEKYADFIANKLQLKVEFFPVSSEIHSALAIFVIPVHAQSIPKSAIECLKRIKALNAYAFPVTVCGNISHGNSLYKLGKLLQDSGFKIIGGAKLISAHSYNICGLEIAKNRPEKNDLETFLKAVKTVIEIKNKNGEVLNLKKFKNSQNIFSKLPKKFLAGCSVKLPVHNLSCINCLKCVTVCPENAIKKNLSIDKKHCIRCLKCAAICPVKARRTKFSQPFIKKYLNSHKGVSSSFFLKD